MDGNFLFYGTLPNREELKMSAAESDDEEEAEQEKNGKLGAATENRKMKINNQREERIRKM